MHVSWSFKKRFKFCLFLIQIICISTYTWSTALLWRVKCFHLVFLRSATLASNSAWHGCSKAVFPAILCSQIRFMQVATRQTAGSSKDSVVLKFKSAISLELKWPTWLKTKAWRGVATSLHWVQSKMCSVVSCCSSQKLLLNDCKDYSI